MVLTLLRVVEVRESIEKCVFVVGWKHLAVWSGVGGLCQAACVKNCSFPKNQIIKFGNFTHAFKTAIF